MRIAAAEKRAERAAAQKRARASDPLRKQRHQALHTRTGIEHTMRRLIDRVCVEDIAKELGCSRKTVLDAAWRIVVHRSDVLLRDYHSVRHAKFAKWFEEALKREPSEYEQHRALRSPL
jgi:hypothetical protein